MLSENTSSDKEMYEVIGALKECKNVISVINKIIEEVRSEEHTSELQSHWYISYAVFCLKKKKKKKQAIKNKQ